MQCYSFLKESYFKTCFDKYLLCLLLALSIHNVTFSKERFSFRKLLNQVHLNMSVGYGTTFYHNAVAGMYVLEEEGKYYLYNSEAKNVVYLIRWFGDSYVCMKTYNGISEPPTRNISNDLKTTTKGKGATFPISLSGHVDILKKFRFELGGALFINKIKTLKPDKKHKHLGDYNDPKGTHYVVRPFALLGFKLLENSAHTLLLNTQVGFDFTYARLSDSLAIHRSALPPPVGIGITVEKHISEYFSAFSRLLYDIKIFLDLLEPEAGVWLKQQSVFLQLGVSLNCPEIPRCPVPHCEVEVKHRHGGKAYRGVSMFRGKDSMEHKIYEK